MQIVKKAVVVVLLLVSIVLFCGDVVSCRVGRNELRSASERVDDALDSLRVSTDELEGQMRQVGVRADLHSFQKDFGKICDSALDGKIGYGEAFINLQRVRSALRSFRNIEKTMIVEEVEIDLEEAGVDLNSSDMEELRAAGIDLNRGKVKVNTKDMLGQVMPTALAPVMQAVKAVEGLLGMISFLVLLILTLAVGLAIFGAVSVIRGKTGPIAYTIYTSLLFFMTLLLTGLLSATVRGLFHAGKISVGIAPGFWLMELTSIAAAVMWGRFKSKEKKAAKAARLQAQTVGTCCRNCGRPLMQGASFCTVCGSRQ